MREGASPVDSNPGFGDVRKQAPKKYTGREMMRFLTIAYIRNATRASTMVWRPPLRPPPRPPFLEREGGTSERRLIKRRLAEMQ